MKTGTKTKYCFYKKHRRPLTAFGRLGRAKDGRYWICRDCRKIQNATHYYTHIDYFAAYRQKHRAKYQAWRAAHPSYQQTRTLLIRLGAWPVARRAGWAVGR